ncbi:hypothetical protein COW80_05465 [Candidatus Beckwithbacteria bacterium CG22_combo_CG10-13_8_21_14_all_01_47_9]|uniref:Probable endonuclease 4 n=4 Tax=Candidatus Beckwithiibacteriota TaxID=1752726 RepID=A0A2H0DZ89_9BACT|nr:MAG: hypothetical protein AUJ59_01775 [Candidatus Beckwithbacteria bacterium CG1_02_47_37]PIP87493.1 MAG: hypothetical protein COW80_05465 [Candidatus Beckwithbacteria bacterium CG22_combo_CG10-13_8_21_14_all_01_47_9]PJA22350.1 MAG: hypothetical protein COX59_03040 [Candidatus Beckwithbacteria bacterium CG_4_10_14_0_2_um_filter_47_25]PJC66164.1 MAG: hypothetical protein CO018_03425 [Candidatus Beckwithbacteria bacterium CG_4_9_14_0_2_um_filter_47_11]
MRPVGAHLSIAGGLEKAAERLVKMGGNCLQVFSASPKSWELPTINGRLSAAVRPAFIHAKYLINLASDKPDLLAKSIASLKYDLQVADLIGAKGVIVHLGSHLGRGFKAVFQQVTESIEIILKNSNTNSLLIIENSAGQQGKLCSLITEIKLIFDAVNSSRLAWCLDTCHAFNAGYSIGSASGNGLIQNDIVNETARTDLVGRLACLHVNDSRDDFASGHDRHANLGEGKIGLKNLAEYVNHPQLKHLPLIIETPGFDKSGPDKKNLDILKSLCV